MLNQFTVEIPTSPVNLCPYPPHPIPEGLLRQAFVSPCRREGLPSILGHTWYIGKRFADPLASSSAPYPQELNPWSSYISEHTSPHVMSESRTPAQDQRCQPRPSAKNSSSFVRENFQRIMEQTNNDCRSQIFISTNSPRQQHSLVGR